MTPTIDLLKAILEQGERIEVRMVQPPPAPPIDPSQLITSPVPPKKVN